MASPLSMKMREAPAPLVAIMGPTASGKSALAVWLALRLKAEIIACDSTQLYRGFDIGTAKPDAAERQGVPHHLVDVLDPNEEATAGDYRKRAIVLLNELRGRGRLPIFTVGTGLYLRALLEGLADAPTRSEEIRRRLRADAAAHGAGYLHRVLQRLDADAARRISPNDEQKLIRAIEVCQLAQRPISQVHRDGRTPLTGWRALKIGLLPARDALCTRIHARVDAMLSRGWLEEVQQLIARGLPENAKPFDFLGYTELRAHLRGELALNEARTAIEQATWRYAKRQLTWFRKESGVHWFSGFGDEPKIRSEALAWLAEQGVGTASRGAAWEGV